MHNRNRLSVAIALAYALAGGLPALAVLAGRMLLTSLARAAAARAAGAPAEQPF